MGVSQRRARLLGRLRSRRSRAREGLVLVEGARAVAEALAAGAEARFAVVSPRLRSLDRGESLESSLRDAGVEMDEVGDAELAELSDTEAPQGVLLVCVQPEGDPATVGPAGRWLVLDAVQDPGNGGTLVRAAAAFGLDGVLALDGTVDLWGAKAVRASAGAAFRLPLVPASSEEGVALLRAAGLPLLLADAAGRDVSEARPGGGWALAVGNEGAGARPLLRDAAEATVRVPMSAGVESLNVGVAGSILMYVLTREVAVA